MTRRRARGRGPRRRAPGAGVPEPDRGLRVGGRRRRSTCTGRDFDLVVAFDRTASTPGRAIAESSFHHFADYNWDTSKGKPSFVTEAPGDAIQRDEHLLDDIRAYIENCVEWLAPQA
jgi:hypothetical protein